MIFSPETSMSENNYTKIYQTRFSSLRGDFNTMHAHPAAKRILFVPFIEILRLLGTIIIVATFRREQARSHGGILLGYARDREIVNLK